MATGSGARREGSGDGDAVQDEGRGLGRSLMSEVARRLAPAFPGLIVWTQAPNAPARGFYERLLGRYVRSRMVKGIEIVGYGWRDIRALVAE